MVHVNDCQIGLMDEHAYDLNIISAEASEQLYKLKGRRAFPP